MKPENPHILLIDDDEINQMVACKFLKKWNVHVTVATDGWKALDLIGKKNFQLIMMDLHMPEMDGQECTRRIRALDDPYFKNIPIILFSASGAIDSKESARKLGMTDLINKPFRQEELKEIIGTYISIPHFPLRSLHIDFDAHTAGDPAFKLELLHLLIENVEELNRSLALPLSSEDPSGFIRVSHKVNSAFSILNDQELSTDLAQLKSLLAGKEPNAPSLKKAVSNIVRIGKELIRSMQHEIQVLQKSNSTQQSQGQ